MFHIEHPRDFLNRLEADRRLMEERSRLLRALRGATPPFSKATERELRALMREQLKAQSEPGR